MITETRRHLLLSRLWHHCFSNIEYQVGMILVTLSTKWAWF